MFFLLRNNQFYQVVTILFLLPLLYSQNLNPTKKFNLPHYSILDNKSPKDNKLTLSFNNNFIINNGHPNIDNNAEIFVPGKFSEFYSLRLNYSNKWISLRLEPYLINHYKLYKTNLTGNYAYNNNHYTLHDPKKLSISGFRQSYLTIKIKNIGMSYGKMSHWWGPGIHSALSLSSNAPSQLAYSIGTFDKLDFGNFSLSTKIIAMPYKNIFNESIYFTGLKSSISYNSKNSIITLGFHRTYLSGDFINPKIKNNKKWTLMDATRLVIEPLFGQSKTSLDYSLSGTTGFDLWDEVLTGYIKINFIYFFSR